MKYLVFFLLASTTLIGQNLQLKQSKDNKHLVNVQSKQIHNHNCEHTSKYWLGNSGQTSYNDYALYVPKKNQDITYINLNFIVLQYGENDQRNFDKNNRQHMSFLQDMVEEMNYRISHFNQYNAKAQCEPIDIFSSYIQFIPHFYFIKNKQLWDYTNYRYTGIIESKEIEALEQELAQSPQYQEGINIYLSNNGEAYKDLITKFTPESYGAYNEKFSQYVLYGNNWARTPSDKDLDKQPRVVWGNAYTKYNTLLWYFADHLGKERKEVYGWIMEVASSLIHEIGHTLGLSHGSEQYKKAYQSTGQQCYENFMSQKYGPKKQLFDRVQLGKMYRNLSNSSARKAVAPHSYTGTSRTISNKEVWDIDTRIYSNIVIEKGAELKLTCNLIIPPQAFILVKKGGSLIIDGGNILSADGNPWQGILVNKKGGTFKDLQNKVDSNNGQDQTPVATYENRLERIVLKTPSKHLVRSISPNPVSNAFTIKFKENIQTNLVVYNVSGKTVYKANKHGKEQKINLTELNAGIYFLEINAKNISNVFKVIKQ